MGVSFKVSRTGVRFRRTIPIPLDSSSPGAVGDDVELNTGLDDCVADGSARQEEVGRGHHDSIGYCHQTVSSYYCWNDFEFSELETSFTLNLFPEGYSIGRPSQGLLSSLLQEQKNLLPYDKEAKTLFLAIEHGWLPGDIFDDIPCKYSNGTIVCEVWDFRKCISILDNLDSSEDGFPKSQRVCLKMSVENVVKDIALMSDESWTYNNLLNAEAQITKALQPKLCLNPNASLDRLYRTQSAIKIDLGICHRMPAKKKQEQVTFNSNHGNLSKGREIMDVTGSKKSTIEIDNKHQDAVASICQQIGPSTLANTQLDCSEKKVLDCNLSTLSEEKVIVKLNKSGFTPKTVAIEADAVLNPSPQPSNPCVAPLIRKRGKQKGQPNSRSREKRLKKEPAQSVSDQQCAVLRPIDPENKTHAATRVTCPEVKMQFNIAHQKLRPEDMENLRSRSTEPPILFGKLTDAIPKPKSLVTQKFTKGTVEFEYPAKPVVGTKSEDHLAKLSMEISNIQHSYLPYGSHSPPCMNFDTILSDEEPSREDNFSRKRKQVSKRSTASTSNELLSSDSKVKLAILQRFKMIERITQRFGPSLARPKSIVESKKGSVSHSPQQLFDVLRLQDMDDMHLVGSATSSCVTRILTFAHFRCSRGGNNRIMTCNCQKKLVLSYQVEKLGQHMVEAQIIFQDEHPIYFGILHNFSQADIFASQFTSLMKRDGYILLEDSIHRTLSNNCSNFNISSGVTDKLPKFPVVDATCITPLTCTCLPTDLKEILPQNTIPSGFATSYNFSQPKQVRPCNHTMQQQRHSEQDIFPDVIKYYLGGNTFQMDALAFYDNLLKNHKKSIVRIEAMRNIMNNASDLSQMRNVVQISGEQKQISCFYNSNLPLDDSGGAQALVLMPNQSNMQQVHMLGAVPMTILSDAIIGHSRSETAIFQPQGIGRLATNLVNNSFTDLVMNNSGSVEQQRPMQMKKDVHQNLQENIRQSYRNDQIMVFSSAPKMNPQQPSANTLEQEIDSIILDARRPQASTQPLSSSSSMNCLTPEIHGPCDFLNEEMWTIGNNSVSDGSA